MTPPRPNTQRRADVAKALARLGSASADAIADVAGYRRADVVAELHALRADGAARLNIVDGAAVWSQDFRASTKCPVGRPRTRTVGGDKT